MTYFLFIDRFFAIKLFFYTCISSLDIVSYYLIELIDLSSTNQKNFRNKIITYFALIGKKCSIICLNRNHIYWHRGDMIFWFINIHINLY